MSDYNLGATASIKDGNTTHRSNERDSQISKLFKPIYINDGKFGLSFENLKK